MKIAAKMLLLVQSLPLPPFIKLAFDEIDLYYCSLSPQTRKKMEEGAVWSVPLTIFYDN